MALSTRMLHADDHLKGERDVAPPISVTVRHPNPRHARPLEGVMPADRGGCNIQQNQDVALSLPRWVSRLRAASFHLQR
jgi:hypothetical protein